MSWVVLSRVSSIVLYLVEVMKWSAAEKVRTGKWHAVVCLNVTGRVKERIAQSKRAPAGSLGIVD